MARAGCVLTARGGRQTSEVLGSRWTNRERNRGLTQVIGNNTSYGHKSRTPTFRRIPQAARLENDPDRRKEENSRVTRFIVDAINDILEE